MIRAKSKTMGKDFWHLKPILNASEQFFIEMLLMRRVTGACDTTRRGSTRKPLIGNLRVTVRRFVRSTRNPIRSCIKYLHLKLFPGAVPDFRSIFFCEIQSVGPNIVESVEK